MILALVTRKLIVNKVLSGIYPDCDGALAREGMLV